MDGQEVESRSQGLVLRLRMAGTELTGEGELAAELSLEDGGCGQGQLLRSRDRKAWEGHLNLLLSQKPEKARAVTSIMSEPVPGSPRLVTHL